MVFKSKKVILSAYGEGQSFGCKITQIDFFEQSEKIMFFIKEGVFLYEYHPPGTRSYLHLTEILSRLTRIMFIISKSKMNRKKKLTTLEKGQLHPS